MKLPVQRSTATSGRWPEVPTAPRQDWIALKVGLSRAHLMTGRPYDLQAQSVQSCSVTGFELTLWQED